MMTKRVTTREWMHMLDKHNYSCIKCGKKEKLTLDHITSMSAGGHQQIDNLQPLCIPCHSIKDGWKANPLYVRLWRKLMKKVRWWKKRFKVYWRKR
jgi:5-methylcytosine-specific restriction endonuclease McrA